MVSTGTQSPVSRAVWAHNKYAVLHCLVLWSWHALLYIAGTLNPCVSSPDTRQAFCLWLLHKGLWQWLVYYNNSVRLGRTDRRLHLLSVSDHTYWLKWKLQTWDAHKIPKGPSESDSAVPQHLMCFLPLPWKKRQLFQQQPASHSS